MEIYRILKPICHLEMRHVTASEAEMLWIMHDFKPYHRIEKDWTYIQVPLQSEHSKICPCGERGGILEVQWTTQVYHAETLRKRWCSFLLALFIYLSWNTLGQGWYGLIGIAKTTVSLCLMYKPSVGACCKCRASNQLRSSQDCANAMVSCLVLQPRFIDWTCIRLQSKHFVGV